MSQQLDQIAFSVVDVQRTERWFRDRWAASGKRLDMGKACLFDPDTERLI